MANLKKQINTIPDQFIGATFDDIKVDLINWLRGQDEFKDYDFAGARINVLVDLLTYATLYIQQFSNTALFESFIRTAALRSSVVQHAQDFGYMPDSRTAATTTVMITAKNPLNPTSIRIPRGTKFVGTVKNTNSYPFVVSDDVVIVRDKDNSYVSMIDLVQGRLVRTETIFDGSSILIRDPNIDRSQVKVTVNGAMWDDWTNESIVNATGASTIFYMRETVDGHTEVYFGEGEASQQVAGGALTADYIGGLKPANGSSVVIEYISNSGEDANGAEKFVYVDTLTNISITSIIENPTNSPDYVGADGGGEPEEIERIRELAPIMRETQRRCVTASDHEAFLSHRFGSVIQAVQCFTDSEKPGYAFVAVKPKSGLRLTTVQKEDMQTYLKKYNIATITPVILDPNYLYVSQSVKVTYDISKLTESEEWLRGQVISAIDKYYTDNVEIFNKSFSKSKMLTYVDNADVSIIGSAASIQLIRELDNYYSSPMSGIHYLNQVKPRSVISNGFKFTNSADETYNVRYASTDANADGYARIVIGPFKDGDISITPYIGSDFEKMPGSGTRNKYYEVGYVEHFTDFIGFDLGILNVASDKFSAAYIELYATPLEETIFTRDGSLIVFENDLRPQYTTLSMNPITQ
ncbi:baseplate wedge protein [Yersinia phage JC221]|nr:baseplate wedge protein [Yersinia phage JC221]